MRDAETVLNIIRDRGRRRLPLDGVYRLLYNPERYLLAYGKISRNAGAMTPGVTDETVDGMSRAKIDQIIGLIRQEKYRFAPARRVYIEKKGSTTKRPLGIPPWADKLVQEAVRLILEAYYEPRFSERSHGFRPARGCHTALREIHRTWRGTAWFIEGDIQGCFDNLDHGVMSGILKEDIRDNRFLRLIEGLLKAGYLEEWTYHRTLSGSPQGGVVSPILANIYLDRLDRFVENTLIPEYTRGTQRAVNPTYRQLTTKTHKAKVAGRTEEARRLRKLARQIPSKVTGDPSYRRLRYVRYADDFLLGFAGPRAEAEEIKRRIGEFLRDTLKLELSEAKTLITHGRSAAARFLGYEVTVMHDGSKLSRRLDTGSSQRAITGGIGLTMPVSVVQEKRRTYLRGDAPVHRPERLNDDVVSIIAGYEAEYRGIANYYRLAHNLHRLGWLKWTMELSLAKTLARKLRVSVPVVYRRYRRTIATDHGPKRVLQATRERDGKAPLVATWGRTHLIRDANATLDDKPGKIGYQRTELVQRLLAETCELCGSTEDVEVHHIKALKNLDEPGRRAKPDWVKVMAARRRKTLVVCRDCHVNIHHGRPTRDANTRTEYRRAG